MPNRPAIPAEVEREIFIEAGHRCAVCGAGLPLERAHIIPWRETQDHSAENLICLCANCHERADHEGWGEATLRQYKECPWVDRNYDKAEPMPMPVTRLQLTIDMAIEHFDDRQQRWLQDGLATYLGISPQHVRIAEIESGSVKVTVELPSASAHKLVTSYVKNKSEFEAYLAPLPLLELRLGEIKVRTYVHSRTFDGAHNLIRVLVRALDLAHDLDFAYDLDKEFARARALTLALNSARDSARILDSDFAFDHAIVRTLDSEITFDPTRDFDSEFARTLDLAHDFSLDLARDIARDLILGLESARDLAHNLDSARDLAHALDLALDLALGIESALDLALDSAPPGSHIGYLARTLVRDIYNENRTHSQPQAQPRTHPRP